MINVLYIAKDTDGFHFAISNGNAIKLSDEGEWLIKWCKRNCKDSALIQLYRRRNYDSDLSFHCISSGKFQKRTCHHAIRDNRIAAESVGINITKFKLMAFTISAAIAGAGGVLYAHNLSTVTATPANFGYNMSIMILVFVVLGGMGSFAVRSLRL